MIRLEEELRSSALLVATLRNLGRIDTGFDAQGVAVAATNLPGDRYPDRSARERFWVDMTASLTAIPGVRSVGVASQLPFSGSESRRNVIPERGNGPDGEPAAVPHVTAVTPTYLETMGIDIVEGRGPLWTDERGGPPAAIVDVVLAERIWPGGAALGQRFWFGAERGTDAEAWTVVGVVDPIRQNSLVEPDPVGAVYLPVTQSSMSFFRLAVKLDGDRSAIWPQVRDAVTALDPALILYWTDTLDQGVADSLILQRTPMQLISAFAALGLFLVAVGVYGVLAYHVERRTPEIGLRLALGGTPAGVAKMMADDVVRMLAVGLVLGGVGVIFARRVIASLLHETGLLDPTVVAATVLVILSATVVACAIPLSRAIRTEPIGALRSE